MVLVLLILLNLLVPQTIESEAFIEVTHFKVPPVVRVGDSTWLRCSYKLSEGDTLHAMKLFKDSKEFYRYTPTSRREDRKLAFLVPGVTVNINRSNERDVLLQDVQKSSAGLYRCEVSVEGTFKSVSVEKTMSVAEASEVAGSNQRNHQRSRQAIQAQSNRANAKASNHITSMLEPSTQGQHKPSSAAASSQLIPGTSFIHLVILCKVLTLLWPALYMTQQHHHQQVTTGNGKR